MATKKPTNDDVDKAISWAAGATASAQERIALLKSHILGDLSHLPRPKSDGPQGVYLLGERELRAMSHEELVIHAMQLTDVNLHMAHMLAQADAYRVATGIRDSEKIEKSAGIVTQLGAEVREVKAQRSRGGVKAAQYYKDRKAKAIADYKAGAYASKDAAAAALAERYSVAFGTVRKWLRGVAA